MEQPLADSDRAVIERTVRQYRYLSDAQQRELEGFVQVFLAEKRFEGCQGLEVTPAMRVCIGAQASLLLLGRKTTFYPLLHSVLLYPSAYVAGTPELDGDGTLWNIPDERIGESWERGSVVLAWDEVERGGADDGVNVVFHEFAHQLDDEAGIADGTPKLVDRAAYARWASVLGTAYDEHVEAVESSRPTLIDDYGAESPAEFFAVATECFFERAPEMKARHPELYAELRAFYTLDLGAVMPVAPVVRRRVRRHPRLRR
jgi:Mlc titration factor MtfA (ptsG expression regulator)